MCHLTITALRKSFGVNGPRTMTTTKLPSWNSGLWTGYRFQRRLSLNVCSGRWPLSLQSRSSCFSSERIRSSMGTSTSCRCIWSQLTQTSHLRRTCARVCGRSTPRSSARTAIRSPRQIPVWYGISSTTTNTVSAESFSHPRLQSYSATNDPSNGPMISARRINGAT